jgi:glycosyltransferase 2 family protein
LKPALPTEQPDTGPLARELYSWGNGLRLLVTVTILALLVRIVDWPEFSRYASAARPGLLLLATGLMFVEFLMTAVRWQVLLEAVGVRVSFMQSLRSYLKGHVVGYIVPVSVASDVVKAVDINMARRENVASQGVEVVSSIFIERAFSAVTVAVAVLVGLAISPFAGKEVRGEALIILSAVLILCCCLAAFYADKFVALMPERWLRRFPRIHALVGRAHDSIVAYRRRPWVLAWVMAFSFAIQAIRVVPVYLLAVAIGAGEAFFAYLIAVPVIFMVNTIPVIGSRLGTEQGLFVLFLGLAGVAPEAALVVAVLKLVLGLTAALPGAYWLLEGRRRRGDPVS